MSDDDTAAGRANPERDPDDPGFWRRPLSSRVVWIITGLAAVVVVAGLLISLSLGVRLF
jgi:hypothetical protein